ncbi:hypothetical protein B9Q10_00570 [Candidatus Marsarchaeota G2 archaeon ECH_B_SAG-E12]|uniref:Major facilitator superfamily (MFS) profile domain-containing protein n=1 Tax=Candidatus Marsarchaeota G2 archaeon ECH_B_SAG-E12 TaxID=1978164 RepID=A0A2R6BX93_9ARCH|nr:MAG: hypothetical protein B9Q10_00570 [Candidatus Marsarchaeota G2 archaeon ECH_B_SAG-E12]
MSVRPELYSLRTSLAVLYFVSELTIFRTIAFPIFASLLGFSDLLIGEIVAVYNVSAILLYYPSSLFSERLGARTSITVSMLLFFLSNFLLAIGKTPLEFSLSFALLGATQSFLIQRGSLIAANTTKPEETTFVYSFATSTGFIGRMLASLCFSFFYFSRSLVDYRIGFFALGVASFAPLPLMLKVKDTKKPVKYSFTPSKLNMVYSSVSFLVGFGQGITITLLQLYFVEKGFNLFEVSLLYAASGAIGFFASRFAKRYGKSPMIPYLVLSVFYAFSAALLSQGLYLTLIFYLLFSFSRVARQVLGQTLLLEVLKAIGEVEKGLGTQAIMGDIGDSLGTVSQGYLFDLGEFSLSYIFGGLAILSGSLLNYYFYGKFIKGAKSQTPK